MDASEAKKKRFFMLAGAVVTVALAALVCWAATGPRALENVKELTVNVEHTDGNVTVLEFRTTERYLYDALAPYELISGVDTETGLFITEVDGEAAEGYNGRLWAYVINGGEPEFPIESQPIEDGDTVAFYTYYN